MEFLKKECDALEPFTTQGINICVSSAVSTLPTIPKTISVNSASSTADFIIPFDKLQISDIDTVILFKYLCNCDDVVRTMRTALSVLKDGGRLIILESVQYSEYVKRSFYPQEMDGLAYLFKDFFSIEQRFPIDNGFIFVLKKKGVTI